MALHVGIGHAERVNANLYAGLPEHQSTGHKLENLINAVVGHCVAADGNTGTVDHQVLTFITVCAVIGIRETNVNRFIKATIWFQLSTLNAVKPFRTFEITLTLLRT